MLKRLLPLLLALICLACAAGTGSAYEGAQFVAVLPDRFEPVSGTKMTCFAPYGDPLMNSSITFYTTESNWYFDRFTDADYESALCDAGYEIVSFDPITACKVDGFDARRVVCTVQIDQGYHTLIVYAVSADRTYFFSLLNRDSDSYIDAFDAMMETVQLKGAQ